MPAVGRPPAPPTPPSAPAEMLVLAGAEEETGGEATDGTEIVPMGPVTDWVSFRFPSPPPAWKRHIRSGATTADGSLSAPPPTAAEARPPSSSAWPTATVTAHAPLWAAPAQRVTTWHLDWDRMVLVHPGQRRKIDLARVTTRSRLVVLCEAMRHQADPADFQALWMCLDQACQIAFHLSLPATLSAPHEILIWPREGEPE